MYRSRSGNPTQPDTRAGTDTRTEWHRQWCSGSAAGWSRLANSNSILGTHFGILVCSNFRLIICVKRALPVDLFLGARGSSARLLDARQCLGGVQWDFASGGRYVFGHSHIIHIHMTCAMLRRRGIAYESRIDSYFRFSKYLTFAAAMVQTVTKCVYLVADAARTTQHA